MVCNSVAFLSYSTATLVGLLLGLTTAAISCSAGTFSQLPTLLLASRIRTQATETRMTRFQTRLLPSERHRDALPGHCLFIKAWDQSTISQHGSIPMCELHLLTHVVLHHSLCCIHAYQVRSTEKAQRNCRHLRELTGLLKLQLQIRVRPVVTGSHPELAAVQQLGGIE